MKLLSLSLIPAFCFSCISASNTNQAWPSAGGPDNTYQVASGAQAPAQFSVESGQNIAWKMDLPEGGQSGITIVGEKIFLTVLEPSTKEKINKNSTNILALCIDSKSQKILWQHPIKGSFGGPSLYGFSDSSTPTPLADDKHVWFYNASGSIVCLDHSGKLIWQHDWEPIAKLDKVKFPFNKQYEPLMSGDLVFNVEPYYKKDDKRTYGWHYIFAYDKSTGKLAWISEDALTHYNTPYMSKTADGKDAILIGRGGHHKVPEDPRGYSLVDAQTGKSIWQYKTDKGMCLYQSLWNSELAIWMTYDHEIHILNSTNGELVKKLDLVKKVDAHLYDEKTKKVIAHKDINLVEKTGVNVFPGWFSNILVGDKLYFMCFGPERYGPVKKAGPINSFARVDIKTGKVEYLQCPTSIKDGNKVWFEDIKANTINNLGLDTAGDKRSKRNGWSWVFNGNPIAVNNKIYFTLQNGRVYVFDSNAETFDQSALLSISDLGAAGKAWSLNTPSFANGKFYHRTLKQLICIENK